MLTSVRGFSYFSEKQSAVIKMARGGKREGAGRRAGVRNKRTQENIDKAEASGLMPLDFMLSILRNEDESIENRCWAAEKAAPYVHAKLANIEHTGKDGGPIDFKVRIAVD